MKSFNGSSFIACDRLLSFEPRSKFAKTLKRTLAEISLLGRHDLSLFGFLISDVTDHSVILNRSG
jgi:hypothetical protein